MAPYMCIVVHLVVSSSAPGWASWVAPGPAHPLLDLGLLMVLVAEPRCCGCEAVPSLGLLPLFPFLQGAAGAFAETKLNHLMCCQCLLVFQETKGKKQPFFFMS